MRTIVTVMIAIVISIITIVGIFTATETVFTGGLIDLGGFSSEIIGCLTGNECELFGGE